MKFVVYLDKHNEWRWRIVARNGRIVGDSAEGYKRRGAAIRQAATIAHGKIALQVDE